MEASICVVNSFPNLLPDSPDTAMGDKLLLMIVGDYYNVALQHSKYAITTMY